MEDTSKKSQTFFAMFATERRKIGFKGSNTMKQMHVLDQPFWLSKIVLKVNVAKKGGGPSMITVYWSKKVYLSTAAVPTVTLRVTCGNCCLGREAYCGGQQHEQCELWNLRWERLAGAPTPVVTRTSSVSEKRFVGLSVGRSACPWPTTFLGLRRPRRQPGLWRPWACCTSGQARRSSLGCRTSQRGPGFWHF